MHKNDPLKIYTIDTLISAPSSLNGFAIYTLEEFEQQIDHLRKPHRHDFYSLMIIESGSGRHIIDSEVYTIAPNRIFLISYGQIHAWIQLKDVKGYIINFTKSFYNLIYTGNAKIRSDQIQLQAGVCIEVTTPVMGEWRSLVQLIHQEYREARREYRELICVYLKAALIKYQRQFISVSGGHSVKKDRKAMLVQQFMELVNVKFKEWKLPKQYAAAMCITPNYLNVIVKQSSGKSSGYIIKDRVILEAKRLLHNTDLTVSEIGHDLGFNDKSNFNKYFKTQVKLTPESFRRQAAHHNAAH